MWTIVDLLVIQAGKGNLPWTVDHAGNVLLEGKERISMWVRSFPLTSHNRICRISLAGLWWGLLLPLGATFHRGCETRRQKLSICSLCVEVSKSLRVYAFMKMSLYNMYIFDPSEPSIQRLNKIKL